VVSPVASRARAHAREGNPISVGFLELESESSGCGWRADDVEDPKRVSDGNES